MNDGGAGGGGGGNVVVGMGVGGEGLRRQTHVADSKVDKSFVVVFLHLSFVSSVFVTDWLRIHNNNKII